MDKQTQFKRLSIAISFFVIFLIISPYFLALIIPKSEYIFGGFLLNPIDGNSYLAKMQEGNSGQWLFTLPYNGAQSRETFLFMFYIFLGHLSSCIGISILMMFHISRFFSSVFLLIVLWKFLNKYFPSEPEIAIDSFLISVGGSGLGWIGLLFGYISSDLWVSEAYPFLSMFSNPHFPLGIGLMVMILSNTILTEKRKNYFWIVISSFALSIILPFGLIIISIIHTLWSLFSFKTKQILEWKSILAIALPGGLLVGYQYYCVTHDRLLSIWNTQNVTPAPPSWDILISFSPAIIFAAVSIFWRIKENKVEKILLPSIWLLVSVFLLFFPLPLQRRFLLGLMIPIAILATDCLRLIRKNHIRYSFILVMTTAPTIIFSILSGIIGIVNSQPLLVISHDEMAAFSWLRENCEDDTVVLASPQTGLFIPGYSDCNVLYGHPFETANASEMERLVEEIFSGDHSANNIDIDYVFIGQRERRLESYRQQYMGQIVFQQGTVEIFQFREVNE